jgi:hypothetical protein
MQTWAIPAAKHAALTSGIGLGIMPAAGWDSLDGVAVGMLLAGIGFAVVSARRVPSCQLPPAGSEFGADGSDVGGGRRMASFKRRMDGLLTRMLSDDADKLTPAAASGRRVVRSIPAAEQRFAAPPGWRGDYVDALPARRSAGSHPYPETQAAPGPDQPARKLAASGKASGGPPWPWLTGSAAVDGERLWPLGSRKQGQADQTGAADDFDDLARALAAGESRDDVRPLPSPAERRRDAVQRFMAAPVVDLDLARVVRARSQGRLLTIANADDGAAPVTGGPETGGPESTGAGEPKAGTAAAAASFWGPRPAAGPTGSRVTAEEEGDAGHRSGPPPDGQVKDKPQDGRRAKPRHAAPPLSFAATLTRRLTSTKLTSKSATHAG